MDNHNEYSHNDHEHVAEHHHEHRDHEHGSHHHHHHHHHHHRKSKKKNKVIIVLCIILGVLILAVGGLLWYTMGTYHHVNLDKDRLGLVDVSSYHQQMKDEQKENSTEPQTSSDNIPVTDTKETKQPTESQEEILLTTGNEEGIMNLLVIGTDSSLPEAEEDIMILDSLTLVSLNQNTNKAKAVGIDVDEVVLFDQEQEMSLKDIYKNRGTISLIRAFNQNYQMDAANFITIDFAKLDPVLKQTNGMEVSLSTDEAHLMGEDKIGGMNHFTMQDMLEYIHLPVTDEFHTREYRQQNTLNMLLKKCKAENLTKYPDMIRGFLDCMETSLTVGDARVLLRCVQGMTDRAAWMSLSDTEQEQKEEGQESKTVNDLQEKIKRLHTFLYS